MRRLVDPATASPYAQILEPVVNAAAIMRGEKPSSELGVSAPDDRTVVIRLQNPAPYLLGLLAQPGTFPVHGPSLAANGAEFARPGKMVSNGAFVLDGLGRRLARRHPSATSNYWNDAATRLEQVHFVHHADAGTEFRQYRAGELDVTYVVPPQQFAWIQREHAGRAAHVAAADASTTTASTWTRPPFKDQPGLRRALSLVIDREQLTTAVTGPRRGTGLWLGAATATADYTPQQFDYAAQPVRRAGRRGARAVPQGGLFGRAAAARSRSATTRARSTTGSPWRSPRCGRRRSASETTLYAEEFRALLQSVQARTDTQVFRSSWVGDFNDAYTFLQLLQTGFGINLTGYSNPRYDALLAEATRQPDPARRRALLEESERVMLADTPVLPLYFYVNKHLVKPYVQGWHDNVMNVQYSKDLRLGSGSLSAASQNRRRRRAPKLRSAGSTLAGCRHPVTPAPPSCSGLHYSHATVFGLYFWREHRIQQQDLQSATPRSACGERYIGQVLTLNDGISGRCGPGQARQPSLEPARPERPGRESASG